jgi:hypothetical protein
MLANCCNTPTLLLVDILVYIWLEVAFRLDLSSYTLLAPKTMAVELLPFCSSQEMLLAVGASSLSTLVPIPSRN